MKLRSSRCIRTIGWLATANLLLCVAAGQEAFEAATIKISNPIENPYVRFQAYPGGRLIVTNSTLQMLAMEAYGLGSEFRVTGGQPWVQKELYDITAKPPAGSSAAAFRPPVGKDSAIPNPNIPGSSELMTMMRGLLADRFMLKAHRETRQSTVLTLTVGRGAPKLKPAQDPSADWGARMGAERDEWRSITMAKLIALLEYHYRRPVVDLTGLTGIYDFRLSYEPRVRDTTDSADLPADDTGRSFKSALESQLGLALREARAPVEVLVIDSASRPSAN